MDKMLTRCELFYVALFSKVFQEEGRNYSVSLYVCLDIQLYAKQKTKKKQKKPQDNKTKTTIEKKKD